MPIVLRSAWIFAVGFSVLIAAGAWADEESTGNAAESDGSEESDKEEKKDGEDDEALKKRVEELENKLRAMEEKEYWTEQRIRALDWDDNRDYVRNERGWAVTWHGEMRTRAIVDANTQNAYTNPAGEVVYAYDPKTTFKNDYGWWDSRLLTWGLINFGDTADLGFKLQLGDWAWGTQSPAFGGDGNGKFDDARLFIREFWVRWEMDPIPLTMQFGRMPWVLGNRMIQGNEQDGASIWYPHRYFEIGAGGFRSYEGENVEMEMKNNDDEDGFVVWANVMPSKAHKLSLFGEQVLFELSVVDGQINPNSPLFKLPNFQHPDNNAEQGSDLSTVGANYVYDAGGAWRVNLEYDHQWGEIKANAKTPGAVPTEFRGFAGFGKLDYRFPRKNILSLAAGYGSGDDPATQQYEGFFAPNNDFGIRDETENENIEKGYFHVYEYLSPGAGVPGALFQNLGSGGIENTTFAHLMWDTRAQTNHHYFVGVGYIQASEPNPITDDAMIGVEVDMRVDYYFSNNMVGAFYGGHLFMLGDYFRPDAHDAATFRFEWRLVW
ncbi:MAG: hypothetical protein IT350_01975 [Deltaproteobacteria bacterium]|nr:hypothetical protein [Deltaproteobacteria bacterium]